MLQLQHSKPGTRSSTAIIDQDYLADIVKRLSFPRVYGTPENARAEEPEAPWHIAAAEA